MPRTRVLNVTMPRHELAACQDSTRRLIRTVDALTDEQLRAPSVLPGWSRAHVVAHLALNAEGLAGALQGLSRGVDTPIYSSARQRDVDIEELARAEGATLRTRLLEGCSLFHEAAEQVPEHAWRIEVPRVPGGPWMPGTAVVPGRRREVEIHHADLGADYGPAAWPEDFMLGLLDELARDHGESGPFRIEATDLGRSWQVGEGEGPFISGGAPELAWWLTGRADPVAAAKALSSSAGVLPRIGAWRRTPAT
ncbi:maleylpyruvate isomerase family mycothiol-dependent enzyme [Myroides odoratimimus subsp. xuanwuensis]